jgi:dethiobiotin synthetase
MPCYFITGTDTGIGKTYSTGLAARFLHSRGRPVITQKIIQTGCEGVSEDILIHRKIMGTGLLPEDGPLTCPCIMPFPASPHLAARLAGITLDMDRIGRTTDELARAYDYVLVEGCGGVHVPINEDATLLDYMEERRYPVLLVSSSRLGSINHTFLTLEALERRHIPVTGILYNRYPGAEALIEEDSRKMFLDRLELSGYPRTLIDIPAFDIDRIPDVDFSDIFP